LETLSGALRGDQRTGLRSLGGLLFGIAAVVIIVRKTATLDPWGEFAIFFTLLVPTVLLYGAGMVGGRARDGAPTNWQIVFAGAGILLVGATLFAFLDWVGGNPDSSWNTLWIFCLVALAAFAAALKAGVRIGYLLGGIALVIAWLSLWDEILSGEGLAAHVTTTRWLLLIAAAMLVAGAAVLADRARPDGGSGDLVTVAGLSAIFAGALSLNGLSTPVVQVSELGAPIAAAGGGSSTFWELELLVVALGLIVFGATASVRGPVYVGAIGLAAFIPLAGIDFENLDGSLSGWPIVLLIIAVALLIAGFVPARRRSDA
jgi:hypothetical protein